MTQWLSALKLSILLSIGCLMLLGACAPISEEAKKTLKQPVNCATAEGDLRLLEHERANVAERVVKGITAIAPAGIVIGVITGTEGDKLKVATGHYNDLIDKKEAEIRAVCGL
ncbi:MAG: hypothetical protein O6945_06410 [Gammaproteobacteria bacterium]|nr:hypothetical protein [Gammaproteobacteria bacterium]